MLDRCKLVRFKIIFYVTKMTLFCWISLSPLSTWKNDTSEVHTSEHYSRKQIMCKSKWNTLKRWPLSQTYFFCSDIQVKQVAYNSLYGSRQLQIVWSSIYRVSSKKRRHGFWLKTFYSHQIKTSSQS